MIKISLKDSIPADFTFFIVARDNDICRTYINTEDEPLTYHKVLRKVKIYPYSKKNKETITIIAEGGLRGKVFRFNKYEGLIECGKTYGYA